MMENSFLKSIPVLVLAIVLLVAVHVLIRLSKNHRSRIVLEDLLLGEDGTMSRSAFVLMASFVVTTWGMVFMWLNDKMTEGYFTAYLGVWATPAVVKLVVNANVAKAQAQGPVAAPSVGNVSVSVSDVKTGESK